MTFIIGPKQFNITAGKSYVGQTRPGGGGADIMALRPVPGQLKSVHLNSLSSVNPCPSNACWYSESQGQDGPWSTWTGGIFAAGYSPYGAAVYWGGGHGGYDGTEAYAFNLETCKWERKGNVPSTDFLPALDPYWCDYPFEGGYVPPAVHTYGNIVYVPASYTGNTKGALVLTSTLYGDGANQIFGYLNPHALDLDTGIWSRFTMTKPTGGGDGYGGSFIDTTRGVVWGTTGSGSNSHYKVDLSVAPQSRIGQTVTGFYSGGWYNTTRYIASKDITVSMWCNYATSLVRVQLYDMATGTPVELPAINLPAHNVKSEGFGWDYCPDTGKFYLYNGFGETTLHVLTPPSDWKSNAAWSWSLEEMGGEVPVSMTERGSATGAFIPSSKWLYNPIIKCFMWSQGRCSRPSPDGTTRDGAFQLYRPIGT